MNGDINYDQCYQILNLRSGASLPEIKQRYRELARRYHPDKVPPAQREHATFQFQQINAAKEVLEAYWERQQSAPPSAAHRRFQDALRRREETQRERAETVWRPRTEAPYPPQRPRYHTPDAPYVSKVKRQDARKERRPVSIVERLSAVLIAETSIFLILWFGYHTLKDLHTTLIGLQIYTANDLMFKVAFGLLVFTILGCGYLTGIALILLAFLLLFVPHEIVLRMLSGRRKRPAHPFPHLPRSFAPRRKW